jgi:O-antigen ligase
MLGRSESFFRIFALMDRSMPSVITIFACLILGLSFINPILPPVIGIGEFTFRYIDVVTAFLLCIIFLKLPVWRFNFLRQGWWIIFKPLFPFVFYIGFSLGLVWIYAPSALWASIASYIRLVTTILIGWLIYMSIEKEEDLQFIVKSIVFFAEISVIFGVWQASFFSLKTLLTGRYGGFLGIGALGFISGLLIIWSAVVFIKGSFFSNWVVPLLSGLLGLFLSKSAAPILATILSIMFLYIVFINPNSLKNKLKLTGILTTGIIFSMIILLLLRTSDFMGLLGLKGGSWAQRLMIGYAALQIFFTHPFGVGWQASKTKEIIGDPNLNKILIQTFPEFPKHYFFLVEQTAIHNMYLQLLAELGIVGFLLFIYSVIQIAKTIADILKKTQNSFQYNQIALFCVVSLIYLLVWWNTKPLYGGHIESILAVSFLSIIARLYELESNNKK